MTLRELNQYADMIRKRKDAEALRETLRTAAEPGAQALTGMPRAPGYKNKLGDLIPEIDAVSRRIEELENQIRNQETKITEYIRSIPDPNTATIFRLRFLRGLDWGEVAETVNGGNTAASVKAICYRHIRKSCHAMSRRVT